MKKSSFSWRMNIPATFTSSRGDYLTIVDPGNDYTGFMDLFTTWLPAARISRRSSLTHGHRDQCMGAFELLRAYPEFTEERGL